MKTAIWSLVAAVLAFEVGVGMAIRLYPFRVLGLTLGDLDPFRYLRLVESVLRDGHLPLTDPFTWPFGLSRALYSANQGYALLMTELTTLSGLRPSEVLSVTPVVTYAVLLASVYLLATRISRSWLSGGIALAFISLTPSWWLLLNGLATNPLAENVAIIFHFLSVHQLLDNGLPVQMAACLAGLLVGVTVLIHPVTTYFTLALFTLFAAALVFRGDWSRVGKAAAGFLLGFLPLVGLLFPWWRSMYEYGIRFTNSAKAISALRGGYFTLEWQRIVADEMGVLASVLACLGFVYFAIRPLRRYRVAALALGLYGALILISNVSPIRSLAGFGPGSGLVLFSHRLAPYFLPWVYIASGVAVTNLLLPTIDRIDRRQGHPIGEVLLLVLVASIALTSTRTLHNARLFTQFSALPYNQLIRWIQAHTRPGEVIATNNFTNASILKALAGRPVLFSLSYEDVVEDHVEARMAAHYELLSLRGDAETARASAKAFGVKYLVVFKDYYFVDTRDRRFVGGRFDTPAYKRYTAKLGRRGDLRPVYADRGGEAYVFEVIR